MSQVWLIFVCSILSFAANVQYGFSTTYVNTPVDEFKQYLNTSLHRMGHEMTDATYNWMWNLILNIWFVGFFVGIWLSPLLNDRYGRKVGFLFGNALSLLSSLLRLAAVLFYLPWLLFVARIAASMAMAIVYQSCILYLQEVSPTHLRGFLSFLSEISYASMCLVGTLLGTPQLLGDHLGWLVFFPVIPCIAFVIIQFFLPETPKYLLIVRANEEAAGDSVRFYHGKNADVPKVLNEIAMEAERECDVPSSLQTIMEIFTIDHLRKATLLSCAALQNTVALWSVLLSSTSFLEDAHVSASVAKWSSTGMTAAYCLGTLTGAQLIERLGRRPLLLTFSVINSSLLLVYVICDRLSASLPALSWACMVSLLLYGYTYGTGIGPISWFISSELVPQRYRSLVQSTCYAINTVAVVITTFSILPLYEAIGSYAFVVLYIIPSSICIFYLYRQLPETKGREIHEIVSELQNEKNKLLDRI